MVCRSLILQSKRIKITLDFYTPEENVIINFGDIHKRIKRKPSFIWIFFSNTEGDILSLPLNKVPNGGAIEWTQGAEGFCSTIGGTMI